MIIIGLDWKTTIALMAFAFVIAVIAKALGANE